jgi:hypothetical protein
MTDVFGAAFVAPASARSRMTSAKLSPVRPKVPILRNQRREVGPLHLIEFIGESPGYVCVRIF